MSGIMTFLANCIASHSFLGLLCLVAIFFYIGLFTIGGGLVGITLMHQVLVKNLDLIDESTFYNMIAISESTPGPIGVNMATYIGTELYGMGGGIITTLGQVTPSIIVILIVAHFVSKFQEKPLVKSAFNGLRPVTTGVIAVAAANVMKLVLFNIEAFIATKNIIDFFNFKALFFYAIGLIIMFCTKLHPLVLVVLGALFGVLFL